MAADALLAATVTAPGALFAALAGEAWAALGATFGGALAFAGGFASLPGVFSTAVGLPGAVAFAGAGGFFCPAAGLPRCS